MALNKSPSVRIGKASPLFYSEAGTLLSRKFSNTQERFGAKGTWKSSLPKQLGTATLASSNSNELHFQTSPVAARSGSSDKKRILPLELTSSDGFSQPGQRIYQPSPHIFSTQGTESMTVGRPLKRSNLPGLDRRVYSDINLFTQVKELQAFKNSGGPITVTVLRTMVEVLKSVVNKNSSFSLLMNWIIECIEDNLFVRRDQSPDSNKELFEHIKVLKVLQIQEQDVTFRAAAIALARKEYKGRQDLTFHSSSFHPGIPERSSVEERSGADSKQLLPSPVEEVHPFKQSDPEPSVHVRSKANSNRGNSSRAGNPKNSNLEANKMSVFFKKFSRPQILVAGGDSSKLDSSNESGTGKIPSVNIQILRPTVAQNAELDTPSGLVVPSDKKKYGSSSKANPSYRGEPTPSNRYSLMPGTGHPAERANSVSPAHQSHLYNNSPKADGGLKSEYGGYADRSYRQSIMTDAHDFEDSECMSVVYKHSHAVGEPSISGNPSDLQKLALNSNPLQLVQEIQKLTEENTTLKANYLLLKQEQLALEISHKKTSDNLNLELEKAKRAITNQTRLCDEAQYFIQVVNSSQEKMRNALSFMNAMNEAVIERVNRIILESGEDPAGDLKLIFPPNLCAILDKMSVPKELFGLADGMEFEQILDSLLRVRTTNTKGSNSSKGKIPFLRGLTQVDRNEPSGGSGKKNTLILDGKLQLPADNKASQKVTQFQTLKQLSSVPSTRKKSMASDQNGKEVLTPGTPGLKSQNTFKEKAPAVKANTLAPKRDTLMPTFTMMDRVILEDDDLNSSIRIEQEQFGASHSRGNEPGDASFEDPSPKVITIGEKKEYKMMISTPENNKPLGSQRFLTQKSMKGSRPASPNVGPASRQISKMSGPMLVRQHSKSINNFDASPQSKFPRAGSPKDALTTKSPKLSVKGTDSQRNIDCLPQVPIVQTCPNLSFVLNHIKDNIQSSLAGLTSCLEDLLQKTAAVSSKLCETFPEETGQTNSGNRGKPMLQRKETLVLEGGASPRNRAGFGRRVEWNGSLQERLELT